MAAKRGHNRGHTLVCKQWAADVSTAVNSGIGGAIVEPVKVLVVAAVLFVALQASAKQHQWREGTLVRVTDDAPGATRPALETTFRYRIRRAYYWVTVGDTTYVLVNSWSVGFHSPKAR